MPGIFRDSAPLRADDDAVVEAPRVPLTAVQPDRHARGGIVVLHESRQFTPALIDLMRALAAEGWLVVAPHLFHREAAHSDTEVFGQNLFDDFDATFDWLVDRGIYTDCVGVLGFDDAGTAAMIVATNRPVAAAVSVSAHGIVEPLNADTPTLVEAGPSLKAPWLGLYGEDDPMTPRDHVERLRDAVARADVATNIVSYSGLAHRADEPPVTEAAAGDEDPLVVAMLDAQRRIFDWFDGNLR
ncbi:dienelactone hydrolase family protein [Rhodococcus sp. TAF43]|uniref:dienelactone hydrolase family protein n=1 Tax=unclassified Rhodococcus (in: high G+C Gram-positive bacteria) TaxID=192944 RepID=UPI001581CB3C|nr:dienelactone hydrolase family protein [Rhodococcus sp. W8901]QKT09627.1 dienelactone hydrolase family protein [Rhodococcus sp. W8901]